MWGITRSFAFLESSPDEPLTGFRFLTSSISLSTLWKNTCVTVFTTTSSKKNLPLPTSQYDRHHQNKKLEEICSLLKSLPSLEWIDPHRSSFPFQVGNYFAITIGYWEELVIGATLFGFVFLDFFALADCLVVAHRLLPLRQCSDWQFRWQYMRVLQVLSAFKLL